MVNVVERFDRANQLMKSRVNVLNHLSSAQLSQKLLPPMRTHAFFSAGVGSARIIEKLREVSDAYTAGKIDKATARWNLKQWLGAERDASPSDAQIIDALSKTARLDLILNQNKANAAAIVQYETDNDPDVLAFFPYKRIKPSTAKVPRASHRHLDNLILPSNDPFWATNTPPIDFNCTHRVELLTAAEAKEYGYTGRESVTANGQRDSYGREMWTYTDAQGTRRDVPLSESGFQLDLSAPFRDFDVTSIPEDLRAPLIEKVKVEAEKVGDDPAAVKTEKIPKQRPPAAEPGGGVDMTRSVAESFVSVSAGIRQDLYHTATAIDSVIAIPYASERYKKIPMVTQRMSAGGKCYFNTLGPSKIAVHPIAREKSHVITHEIGHMIDSILAPRGAYLLSQSPDEAMSELLAVLYKSESYGNIGKAGLSKKTVAYLKDPPEVFARAFAQYIAQRSGDQRMLLELAANNELFDGKHVTHWSKEVFAPIMDAFDKFFESKGLLRKPRNTNPGGQK